MTKNISKKRRKYIKKMEITPIGLANSITKSTLYNYICLLAFSGGMVTSQPTDIDSRFIDPSQLIFPKE